ncbi:hypothetical protein [Streptomyces roseoviridis]|uniref:Restriction endonuclease type IV Mrr domain-containing protein n=1 Tax=Streptomyces roseoviridis TaxID=67361 RepID=A0ABV5QTC5_9ACTN
MGESVQVRCPECFRSLRYAAPAFPCSCGTPVAPPVIAGATAVPVTHRNWSDEWVTVHCLACSRASDWPHPEVGCPCGAVLRVPVRQTGGTAHEAAHGAAGGSGGGTGPGPGPASDRATGPAGPESAGAGPAGADTAVGSGSAVERDDREPGGSGPRTDGRPAHAPDGPENAGSRKGREAPAPTGGDGHRDEEAATVPAPAPDALSSFTRRHPSPVPPPRPTAARPGPEAARTPFRPVTIRTTRDAVAASAGYLRWLGFRDVVQPEERSASAVDLRGPGLVAQVDPSTRPTGLRAVECLWLNGLSSAAVSVCFSLAGYTHEAHERAEGLGIPLFVLDLTGTPQPVNAPAHDLLATGAP